MRCPTCSSPLPDGAMFCGQCGRAITAADVAAFRAAQEPEPAAPDAAPAPSRGDSLPAWSVTDPAPSAVPAGTPWWTTGRAVDEVDSIDEAPAVDDAPAVVEASAVADVPRVAEASGVDAQDPVADVVETPADAPEAAPDPEPRSSADGAGRVDPADWPRGYDAPAVPVVAPPRHDAGRPASAPLWTASLADVEKAEPDAVAVGTPTDGIDADPPVEGGSRLGAQADARVAEAASDPAGAAPSGTAPSPAPHPGDTNVIPPLVAPRPAGAGPLTCTVCGAPIAPDDIFCGECGTVVESVAQSFTGPITPIQTGVAPHGDATSSGAPASKAESSAAAVAGAGVPAGGPREAPLAATPITPGLEPRLPFVPDEETPPTKKRRLFGRRAIEKAPELWSALPSRSAMNEGALPLAPPAAPVDPAERVVPPSPAPEPVSPDEVPRPTESDAPPTASPAPLRATSPSVSPDGSFGGSAPIPPAAIPPAPASPRPAAPWAIGAPNDDVEKTRIVEPRPIGEAFVLQFSTGESFTVQGTGLVGRAPTPQPGEAIDLLVRIVDPGKSVSKTHLEFGQEAGSLWVSDRWSGNGSVVREPGREARRCDPGKRVRVPRGARVDIGEQFFIVG